MKPTTTTKPHIVTREFDAPRDLVWEVSTNAEHLAKWFAPKGHTGFVKSMDFRPGGVLHYGNHANDGSSTIWGKASYIEIRPKERITFLQSFSDEHGAVGSHPLAPGWPKIMYCLYRFDALGDSRTRLTVEWTPAEDSTAESIAMFDGAREGMNGGWKGTLDKMEAYLNSVK